MADVVALSQFSFAAFLPALWTPNRGVERNQMYLLECYWFITVSFSLLASICAMVSNMGKDFVSGVNVSNNADIIAVEENNIDGKASNSAI